MAQDVQADGLGGALDLESLPFPRAPSYLNRVWA